MGLSVTIATLVVMTVITNCEGTGKIDHRESHSTLKGPLIHSQGTLPCAGVLSGGEKNLTESELWARLDWLEGLVLQIASEHSHDRIAITAIGSNILMTIIFCRTLLYVYRQLRMDGDIKLGAKSDRAKWPDSNNGTMNVKTAIASIEFQGSNVNASTMTESSLEYKQGKSIGSWAEQSRVHWGKLCLVCQQGVTISVRGQNLDKIQREVFCTPISAWLGLTQHHVGRKSAIIVSEKGIKEWTSKMQTLGAKIKKLQIAKHGSIPITKWDPS